MGTVTVLDREMYSEAEAARLLEVPQQTLHYWLEGKKWRGYEYKPAIRIEPTGQRTLTWAEFVEAGLLSQYRKKNVPLEEVRRFISVLRDQTGSPYPLATARPWAVGQKLVVEAQIESGLSREYWLYAPVDNQLVMDLKGAKNTSGDFLPMELAPTRDFLERVEFADNEAILWHPAGKSSPVVIDPDRRFGRPSVGGISTSVVNEYATSGYSYEEIAQEFNLTVRDVEMAVAYELSSKAA
ncbi:DUF433 domain-containing protein [Mycolicibacterium sp. OfavD-34-C]|uniref:DUF433 domain-containing protein n=1 Tax=Mycolicibacterium sp. OfavD-34-C TaxID=2917746 RepID=UPI001EF3ED22|nr:DUF433 domain-containing protein [Mycolicibacterium sp. OfavD-34-C]MCG7582040.1 DUF433 domain-containing protein [Mycolicibacterium sp. OfavD-34-C]